MSCAPTHVNEKLMASLTSLTITPKQKCCMRFGQSHSSQTQYNLGDIDRMPEMT